MRRGIYCRQYTQTTPTANYFSFQECLSIRVSMDQVIALLSQAIMVSCLTLCSKLCQNCDSKNAKSSHKIPIKAKLAYHLLPSPENPLPSWLVNLEDFRKLSGKTVGDVSESTKIILCERFCSHFFRSLHIYSIIYIYT